MFYRILFIAVAVMVSGCSDPKAANEKNFKIAIQKTLDAEFPKCYITANFPATVAGFDVNNHKAIFPALVKAGLLSEKNEPHEVPDGFFGNKKKIIMQAVFDLTDEGKRFYKADAEKSIMGEDTGGFCFGKAEVKEITEFTEPTDAMGMRISQVKFTYAVSDFPAWAKSSEISAAISSLGKAIESEETPIKGADVLALTNNGWVSKLGGLAR